MPQLKPGKLAEPRRAKAWSLLALSGLALVFSALAETISTPPPPAAPPTTPRQFYNAGTDQLRQGKLREAEAMLEAALAGQDERLQPPSLYNLGHVRFAQGGAELKKAPPGRATAARGEAAAQQGADAIRAADEALQGNDLQKMIAAYWRGRGARKEMREAADAVRRALTAYGTVLAKWQRAESDFNSALELIPTDADARQNADVVDRYIAKLVDSLRQMQQCQGNLGNKRSELSEKLKELKGRIPAPQMPPGAAGDDEEDEDEQQQPPGPPPGSQEGPTKEGAEMTLSEEQAGWLLEGYKLDKERKLPMGQGQPGQPKDRNRPTW